MSADMRWRPRRLTPAQLEERQLVAARLFRAGRHSQAEIARRLMVSRQSVARWYQAWEVGQRVGLARRPHTGRRAQLDAAAWTQLAAVLARGALAAGFETERWTLRRIAVVAGCELGVRLHFRSFSRILRTHDWSPQVPAVQAKERDEALVRRPCLPGRDGSHVSGPPRHDVGAHGTPARPRPREPPA